MIYLDYNASAPISQEVLYHMNTVYDKYIGNPDSMNKHGRLCMEVIERAKETVLHLFPDEDYDIIFTSGATEANNIAMQTGCKGKVVTTAIEHKSVLEYAKAIRDYWSEAKIINPLPNGSVTVDDILDAVDDATSLVSVMHVNNETGIIQPIVEIGKRLRVKNTLFHVDATQSFGKRMDELRAASPDMISFSAHKFGGPQGIGGLIYRKSVDVFKIFFGGKQQNNLRAGTMPTALIAGLGYAVQYTVDHQNEINKQAKEIRKTILDMLNESGLEYSINGDPNLCVNNSINMRFAGVNATALLLSAKQYVSASTGSACNLGESSYVLKAMGMSDIDIAESFRLSWGYGIEYSDYYLKKDFKAFIECARKLRDMK